MAEEYAIRPTFFFEMCPQCEGTKKSCIVCSGSGKIEYLHLDTGPKTRADLWRNSPEGIEAESQFLKRGEYPTWKEIKKAVYPGFRGDQEPRSPPDIKLLSADALSC